jgi:hypothetical protein
LEEFFFVEVLHVYGVLFFRQEKSFQDLLGKAETSVTQVPIEAQDAEEHPLPRPEAHGGAAWRRAMARSPG